MGKESARSSVLTATGPIPCKATESSVGSRANSAQRSKAALVPIPIDPENVADELARAMVADILESSSLEEIRQLIAELEAKLRNLH
jgi:hypothetical protein